MWGAQCLLEVRRRFWVGSGRPSSQEGKLTKTKTCAVLPPPGTRDQILVIFPQDLGVPASAFLKPNSDRDEQGGGASEARGHARTEHRRPERATTVAHYGEAHRTRPPSWRALPARAASSVCMLVCP